MTTDTEIKPDPFELPYEAFPALVSTAVQVLSDEWKSEHPGREPTEADLQAIAEKALTALEEELPGFSRAYMRAKFAEFIEAEFRAWQAEHPGQNEPPEPEKQRMITIAKARLLAGHEPRLMT